jgi:hypothetical protein
VAEKTLESLSSPPPPFGGMKDVSFPFQSALIRFSFSQCKMLLLHIVGLKSETFFVEGMAL